jgi:hypothetical protein
MKTNGVSRRMFLQGAGGFLLSIPTLSSLLSKPARVQAQASTTPVRYVQWITDHGQFDQNFWPAAQFAPSDEAVPGVKARALSSISGRMSLVLGEDFDGLRAKMNLIRGLDLMVTPTFHNACVPTCASWPREDNHIPTFSYSVDSILESSSKVYPTPARVAALRMTPGVSSSYKWGSFCWTTREGKPFKLPAHSSSEAALNAVFTGGAGSPVQSARLRLTDQVLEDYRNVSGSRAIGAADKQQLSHYMDLLADLQNRMKTDTAACTKPAQAQETDFNVLHQNGTDIAVAALLCGATRVVAYHCYQGSPTSYDEETFHSWAHNDAAKHGTMMNFRYKQLARLLRTMDQFKDPDGRTVLDNSMVYASNELSEPGHGGKHLQNMPIVVAGSAGGKLSTGNYIDFQSRLLNNMLITVFAAMGLEASDYERNGVEGFGDYQGSNSARYSAYVSTAERRKPLPLLFRG